MAEADILVVEDEPNIQEVVGLYLTRAGYGVSTVGDGEAAIAHLSEHPVDLVVLDLMLPRLDGLAVTRWLRDRGETPIIMLTARRQEADRIAGLELGADDYLVKPFSPGELVSRVRAVLRRTRPAEPAEAAALAFGPLTIDPRAREVHRDGTPVDLTAREFDLLLALARQPRRVFTRDQLLDQVWGSSDYIDPSTVTVHVRRLREKVETDPSHPQHIVTVWGVGYRFEP